MAIPSRFPPRRLRGACAGAAASRDVRSRCSIRRRGRRLRSTSIPGSTSCGRRKVLKLAQGRVARGLRSETENTMSNSISTLLLRNLSCVFGGNDPVRRRAAIDEIFHEDAVFYDAKGGIFRGRDEIDRIAGVIKATHPDFEYQPLFPPEELGDAGRVRWVSGTPGKPPAYAGTDFIVARNGRIASVYLFFDNLP